jgi:hypothetical protein
MGRLWTHEDWNDIIRRVNDLIGPCDYADYVTPLPEVAAGHIWSATDISAVRNRLQWMCRNAPEDWCEQEQWKLEIIDELNEAIDDCDCGCTQAVVDDTRSLHERASYVPYLLYPQQFTKNEWLGGDDHWHFQWTYRQDYDYTIAMGRGYGARGMSGVGHFCRFTLSWWYWPWEGDVQFVTIVDDLGTVECNCDGVVTAAPSGTYIKTFPVDYRLLTQPGGGPFTVWNTAGAGCC